MKKRLALIFILALTSCGIDKEPAPPVSTLAGGDLAPEYGSGGFFTHGLSTTGSRNDEGNAITMDTRLRIIVVGSTVNASGNLDMAVWRLTPEGELDTTFSNDGIFTHNDAAGGNGDDVALGVVTGPSDEIYITGYSKNALNNDDMVIWKLTSTGVLDTTFNGTGVLADDGAAGGNVHDQGAAIALDSAGYIYVVGYSDQTAVNRDMALWKFTPNGVAVGSFGTGGVVTSDSAAGGVNDYGHSLYVDSESNIYVAGRADSPTNTDMAVWKFRGTGSPVNGFGTNGVFTHNNAAGGNAFDAATGVAVDSEGGIYVSGYSRNAANNNDMVVWKLTQSGVLDPEFGGGIFVFNIAIAVGFSTHDAGEAIAIDSEDNIVVVGSGNNDVAAWRLTPDGLLDPNFNGDGSFFHDSAAGGFGIDAGKAIYMDLFNEEIYIGGYSENAAGNFDMAVWKLK